MKEFIPPIALRGYRAIRKCALPVTDEAEPMPDVIRRNVQLKDRHKDVERCFIVGNGPSLQHQDLRPLRNEIVFVSNFFDLHTQCGEISPIYWCIAAPDAFDTVDIGGELEIQRDKWFKHICMQAPHTEFLLPFFAKKKVEQKSWLSGRKVWYAGFCGSALDLGYMDSNLATGIPQGHGTIDMMAIPGAIYMGFRKIYLLGCDTNFFVDSLLKGDLHTEVTHFYKHNPFVGRELKTDDLGCEFWFRSIGHIFKCYRLIREHAEQQGVQIFNATKGGLLDVFPRCKYEDIIASSPASEVSNSSQLDTR